MSRSFGRDVVDDARPDRDLAGRRLLQAGDHPQRGRLARPGRPDQDRELAVGDLQIQPVDGFRAVVEHLGHVLERDRGHYARTSSNRSDVIPVPERAALGNPLLRVVVHAHDAEALVVAVLPLEVVEQRPGVVAPDVHAVAHGAAQRLEMRAQIGDARGVLDHAVDQLLVVERGAVLGDPDLQVAVVGPQPHQHVVQAAGVDRPAHGGDGAARGEGGHAQRRLRRRPHVGRVVVVDAEEVDRPRDHVQVLGVDRQRPEDPLVGLDHVAGIRPAQHRIEEPAVLVRVHAATRRRRPPRIGFRFSVIPTGVVHPRAQRVHRQPVRRAAGCARPRAPSASRGCRAPCALPRARGTPRPTARCG